MGKRRNAGSPLRCFSVVYSITRLLGYSKREAELGLRAPGERNPLLIAFWGAARRRISRLRRRPAP